MTAHRLEGVDVELGDPVLVAASEPGEDRWGFHQFPTISRLPSGRLLVTYNAVPDRDDSYGHPGPAYESADDGATWEPYSGGEGMLTISHSVVSEVNGGEHLCVPMSPSIDVLAENVDLPAPCGTVDVYGEVLHYRIEECDERVQEYMCTLPAARYDPRDRTWRRTTVEWDTAGALVRTRRNDYVLPRPYIDNPIVRIDERLYYPDFHLNFVMPDGSMPKNYACRCMVSDDNGRSWHRYGLIAYDEAGDTMMGEPSLCVTPDGDMVCVIRCTDHRSRPMLIARSSDRGLTWSAPEKLHDFGVMPQTVLLGSGVMALSFGRPGAHVVFSADGTGRQWTVPVSMFDGERGDIDQQSCGYTGLVPLDDECFLIVYSDLKHLMPDGTRCRAIFARRVRADPRR